MVRIKVSGDENTHLEMRAGSAASNPYLLAAAVLAAGLLGIKADLGLRDQSRDCPSEDNPTLPKLPQSLDAALGALEADQLCALCWARISFRSSPRLNATSSPVFTPTSPTGKQLNTWNCTNERHENIARRWLGYEDQCPAGVKTSITSGESQWSSFSIAMSLM